MTFGKTAIKTIILSVLVAAAIAGPLALSGRRLLVSLDQLAAASSRLEQTVRVANRIVELRQMSQTIAEQKRPEQDVIAKVSAVLAEAGIPSEKFGGLRPESDTAMPNGHHAGQAYRRQSVRIVLNELTTRQIGEFLDQWSESQPLWIPSRIELTHVRANPSSDLYSLNLLLTATYVAEMERS